MDKHPKHSPIARLLGGLTLIALVPFTPGSVQAEADEAMDILLGMTDFLAGQPRFSVAAQSSYDAVQPDGQKIEFAETRHLLLARPDHLRVDLEESDGLRHQLIYNGHQISLATPQSHVYAQVSQPGTVDDAVRFFIRDLDMRLPFAVLLVSNASEELQRRTRQIDYVEQTHLAGVTVHHLAGRTDSVDYQVWVRDGDIPLPVRLVLTYPEAEGQPQFRADFHDWDLKPVLPEDAFVFTPPADAREIPFASELPGSVAPAVAPPSSDAPAGGQP